ncbi:MAG: hypothetical protein E6F99_05785 [Actinobacteria bacterium]|nr:MAG: hypothetical protein E6F99_05785 [Actinomycetota bacterium]
MLGLAAARRRGAGAGLDGGEVHRRAELAGGQPVRLPGRRAAGRAAGGAGGGDAAAGRGAGAGRRAGTRAGRGAGRRVIGRPERGGLHRRWGVPAGGRVVRRHAAGQQQVRGGSGGEDQHDHHTENDQVPAAPGVGRRLLYRLGLRLPVQHQTHRASCATNLAEYGIHRLPSSMPVRLPEPATGVRIRTSARRPRARH